MYDDLNKLLAGGALMILTPGQTFSRERTAMLVQGSLIPQVNHSKLFCLDELAMAYTDSNSMWFDFEFLSPSNVLQYSRSQRASPLVPNLQMAPDCKHLRSTVPQAYCYVSRTSLKPILTGC